MIALAVFHSNEKYETIFDRIRYLMLKSNISNVYSHNYTKIKINSDNDLPFEKKTLIMHNVVICIKSAFNQNHNHYYYKMFLEKCSFK